MLRRNEALGVVIGFFVVAACSSTPRDAASQKPASSKSDDAGHTYLGLETPTDGFQVRNAGITIGPGADEEYCEVQELPGAPSDIYYVNGVEMANGEGSHHLIISVATPGTPSDAKLRSMKLGERVPCVSAQIEFGEDLPSVGGIQHPYGKTQLPDGIAQKYAGGSRVVFDYHYFNTSEEPVDARSAFNFHLVDARKVKQLAGGFGFYNWTIDTPPGATRAFTADCRLENDATVFGLARHTHRWGRDFSTWFAGGDRDGELIWTTPDFNTDTEHEFDGGTLVKAGDGFKFQCSFDNTESYPLRFGVKATDEMCILFGTIWDANGAYDPPEEKCAVTWTDPAGIGHPASYAGAFPPPPAAQAALCLGGAGNDSACTTCSCNSCGDLLVSCFTDQDCGPIVQCFQNGGDCQSAISDHSRGLGLAQQVSACVGAKCNDACGGGL